MATSHDYLSPSRGLLVTPGLTFNKEEHTYLYNGKALSGVTGAIGKSLKKNFPAGIVEEHRTQGSHVHDAIEAYVRTGKVISVHPAARWAIGEIQSFEEDGWEVFSEVLVSDFKKYASAIDLLLLKKTQAIIIDTKAGNFDRSYVSIQIGIYRHFLESVTPIRVDRAYCLSTKYSEYFPIFMRSSAEVKSILY